MGQDVLRRAEAGTLHLYSTPAAKLECGKWLRRRSLAIEDAVTLLEESPALAARALVAANRDSTQSSERARTAAQAVTKLGVEPLRNLLLEATGGAVYGSHDSRILHGYSTLWGHSRGVASCARLAATMFRAGDPEEAHLAGLLHDIGALAVGSLLAEAELRLVGAKTSRWMDPGAWLDVVQETQRKVGVSLAQSWKLPDTVVRVVANGSAYDEVAPRSVVNCVRLAKALASEMGVGVGQVDRDAVAQAVQAGQSLLGAADRGLDTLRSELWCFRPSGADRSLERA
jgi:HD-like signal output (HDOD) protein